MKEPTLFDLEKAEKRECPRRMSVKQRLFSIHYGAMYILIEELSSGWTYSATGWGKSEMVKPFQLLTEEVEAHPKGINYAVRSEIIGRIDGLSRVF